MNIFIPCVMILCSLQSKTKEHPSSCSEYFTLLCRLLNYGYVTNSPMPNAEILLNNEIDWLKKVRVSNEYYRMYGICSCDNCSNDRH